MDPTIVLPDELVGEIFRRLNFAGRLAASHVCASWRRVALSDRRLWADYSVPAQRARGHAKGGVSALLARLWVGYGTRMRRARYHAGVGVVSALLERSDPLPFRLHCTSDVPDAVSGLVIAHMARMEDLSLGRCDSDEALQRILAQDIPLLKRFAATRGLHGDGPMRISTRWASAPRLERLSLTFPCVWPANCVIGTLRSYSGGLPEGPELELSLLQMFPNLEVLSLHCVTQALLRRLTPLPPGLTALELRTPDFQVGIDPTALLRDCTTSRLRELLINWTHSASCVLEVIRLFERRADAPWKLYLFEGIIRLRALRSDPPPHHYFVVYEDPSFPARIAEIVPFCGRLCDLEMPLAELLSLCASNAVLPALSSVSIILTGYEDSGAAHAPQQAPGIQAPVLRSLRLRSGSRLPVVALLHRIVRAFHAPLLATIIMETDLPKAVGNDDVAAFLVHAPRLEIRSLAGQTVYVFGQAESLDGSAERKIVGAGTD